MSQHAERRRAQFKRGGVGNDAHFKRREQVASLRKDQRSERMMHKRRKANPAAAAEFLGTNKPKLENVIAAISTLESFASSSHSASSAVPSALDSLRSIRLFLSHPFDPSNDNATTADVLDLPMSARIIACITPFLDVTAPADIRLEALWCTLNLASCEHETTLLVLPCVSALLLQLQVPHASSSATGTSPSASSQTVLEHECKMQAVWALGNIAADGQETCALLWENGVISPLVQLFTDAAQQPDGQAMARTTAWALSNLARGNTSTAVPFVKMGVHTVVVGALGRVLASDVGNPAVSVSTNMVLISELCWVLVYLTAREPECIEAVLQVQMVLPILLTLYRELAKSPKQIEETDAHKALVPIQRIFYNILAAGNTQWTNAMLSTNIPTHSSSTSPSSVASAIEIESTCDVLLRGLEVVLAPATYDVAKAVSLEGAWLSAPFLANLGAPGTLTPQVANSRLIQHLCWLFINANARMRHQAGVTLRAFASHTGAPALVTMFAQDRETVDGLMDTLCELLRSSDFNLVELALDLLDQVASHVALADGTTGISLAESSGATELVENLVYLHIPPPAGDKAASLVERLIVEEDDECGVGAFAGDGANPNFAFTGGHQQPTGNSFSFGEPAGLSLAGATPLPGAGRGRGRALLAPSWLKKT